MTLLNSHLHLRLRLLHYPTRLNPKPVSIPSELPLILPHRKLARPAHPPIRHVAAPAEEGVGDGEDEEENLGPASAAAVAAAIRRASSASPVRFRRVRRGEEGEEPRGEGRTAEPSADFQCLCAEQLEMFRVVVSRDAVLSVYVRPAGSYIMDQLELRRVALHPEINVPERETVMLVGDFSISAGLRAAEVFLVKRQMEVITEFGAIVLPMVKHPFVVGFLVAELPELDVGRTMDTRASDIQLPSSPFIDRSSGITPYTKGKAWDFRTSGDKANNYSQLVTEWKNSALIISRTLAMAYVMDQKAYLLQQTSWQNNVRMSGLVEQIRGPLSNIRVLAKMLSIHTKRSQIPYDIVEDILIQGDHLKDALQQIQDAVYLTKANIVRYNEEILNKIQGSPHSSRTLSDFESVPGNSSLNVDPVLSLNSDKEDMVMPMPPLWLAPLQHQDARQFHGDINIFTENIMFGTDGRMPMSLLTINSVAHLWLKRMQWSASADCLGFKARKLKRTNIIVRQWDPGIKQIGFHILLLKWCAIEMLWMLLPWQHSCQSVYIPDYMLKPRPSSTLLGFHVIIHARATECFAIEVIVAPAKWSTNLQLSSLKFLFDSYQSSLKHIFQDSSTRDGTISVVVPQFIGAHVRRGIEVLQVPWDPGDVEFICLYLLIAAWGQAAFQGGKNVTDRPRL